MPNAPVRKIYFLLSGEVGFDDRGKKKQWEANAVVNQGREREV